MSLPLPTFHRSTTTRYRFLATPDSVNNDLVYDLANAPATFWDHVRSDGGDIRVTAQDGTTKLAREVSGFGITKGSDFAPRDLTAVDSHSPFVVADSAHWSTYDAHYCFDGSAHTYWIDPATTGWVSLDIGSGNAKRLYSYSLQANDIPEPNRMPKDFTFQGSNNGTDWVVLDTQTNQTGWGNAEVREFTLSAPANRTKYRYFKINVTANNGDASYTVIAELCLYEAVVAGSVFIGGLFSPNSIPNLELWLDAGKGVTVSGTDVTAVADQSGKGNDLTAVGTPVYVASAINGLPGINCAAGYLINTTDRLVAQNGARHIFIVRNPIAGGTGSCNHGGTILSTPAVGGGFTYTIQSLGYDTSEYVYTDGVNVGMTTGDDIRHPAVMDFSSPAGTSQAISIKYNGTEVSKSTPNTGQENNNVGVVIGNRTDAGAGQAFHGQICEVLFFSRVLTTDEEEKVRAYLASKYGLSISTPSSASYIPSCYIYYGNASATEPAADSTYGKYAVWESAAKLVAHLEDVNDSTVNQSDGTISADPPILGTGKIAKGYGFTAAGVPTQYIDFDSTPALGSTSYFTATAWFKTTVGNNAYIFVPSSAGGLFYLCVGPNGTTANKLSFYMGSWIQSASDVNDGSWHKVDITFNAGNLDLSVDNVSFYNASGWGALSTTNINEVIGYRLGQAFTGTITIDEVRIYDRALSSAERTTHYANQNDPASFWTTGGEEEKFNPFLV